MRRTTAVAVAVLLAAGLTACGASDDKPDAKASASPTASKADNGDEFLNAVHAATFDSWATERPTDAELLMFPPQWCAELDAGHSVKWLFDMQEGNLYPIGPSWGTKQAEANELLVMGVKSHCPELRSQVTDELRDSGEF